MSMDDNMNQWAESGPYIWLRYATQYTRDGQTHTIEMSIPVPVGASAETRERLIREAEAGMSQLSNHVERRGTQPLQRTQGLPPVPGVQGTQRLAPMPASNTKPTPGPRATVRPASASAPQTSPQPVSARENEFEDESTGSTGGGGSTMRPNAVPNMPAIPRSPGRSNEMGNNMLLPQFIQYIKENLDLTPKQAMELLNVRSLSTGINLRDAVEQLKAMVGTGTPGSNGLGQLGQRRQDSGDSQTMRDAFPGTESERGRQAGNTQRLNKSSDPVIEMSAGRPAPTFDEEVGPEDLNEADEGFDDLEDLEVVNELSPQVLEKARSKLGELRESQGAATASAGRLQALNNVAISQITEEQLQELVDGVWGISALKKLKVDQVEALISWAKLEDDFAEQVEAVLVVLEEEHYARGNR
ncbi:MAG: hypothetical protein PVS3B1_28920 [Ktedonobacteraceae bacterium]